MKKLANVEAAFLALRKSAIKIPSFRAGDTLKVITKASETSDGKQKIKIVTFLGLCIARRNNGIASRFTLRKVSGNSAIEKSFAVHSPLIQSITIMKFGHVRRAKLYYMRTALGNNNKIKAASPIYIAKQQEYQE